MKNETKLVTHGCQSLRDIQCVPMDGMSACDLSRNIKTFQQNVPSNPEIRDPRLQFWLEFIEIYRENTPLWNTRSEEFHDKQIKAVCYDKLITKMKEVLPSAKKINVTRKLNILRGKFRR